MTKVAERDARLVAAALGLREWPAGEWAEWRVAEFQRAQVAAMGEVVAAGVNPDDVRAIVRRLNAALDDLVASPWPAPARVLRVAPPTPAEQLLTVVGQAEGLLVPALHPALADQVRGILATARDLAPMLGHHPDADLAPGLVDITRATLLVMRDVLERCCAADARRLVLHGAFLADKFGAGSLEVAS